MEKKKIINGEIMGDISPYLEGPIQKVIDYLNELKMGLSKDGWSNLKLVDDLGSVVSVEGERSETDAELKKRLNFQKRRRALNKVYKQRVEEEEEEIEKYKELHKKYGGKIKL